MSNDGPGRGIHYAFLELDSTIYLKVTGASSRDCVDEIILVLRSFNPQLLRWEPIDFKDSDVEPETIPLVTVEIRLRRIPNFIDELNERLSNIGPYKANLIPPNAKRAATDDPYHHATKRRHKLNG